MNSIVSNTTKWRCAGDADTLIEAGISFRFEQILDAFVLFVADEDLKRASQAIHDARS